MDSLTQIVLGAAVTEAAIGKKVGRRAAAWGAVAGTIPDLDVISANFLGAAESLDLHRAFSHSVTFAVLFAPLMAYGLYRLYRQKTEATWWHWTMAMFLALVTHPILDSFTTWGTELFWPFDATKLSWRSIFVVDPLYTLPFLLLLIVALFFHKTSTVRRALNYTGLTLSTLYLGLTLVNKAKADEAMQAVFAQQGITYDYYESKPMPLNNILWVATAYDDKGFYVNYHSFLDEYQDTGVYFIPRQEVLPAELVANYKVQKLLRLTNGLYTTEFRDSCYVINDLRFGRSDGLAQQEGPFVFAYYLFPGPDGYGGEITVKQERQNPQDGLHLLNELLARIKGIQHMDDYAKVSAQL